VRVVASLAVGIAVGVPVSVRLSWQLGLLLGWMAAATLFTVWMWVTILPLDAQETALHSEREDTGRATSDVLVLIAAVASLAAVALLLAAGSSGPRKDLFAALGVTSVALAWATVHTLFTTRYAKLYYTGRDGGIEFNEPGPPRYTDFAYVAFTIGMTYQVSDTTLQTSQMRRTALRHALLSYVFGVGIIATTINLVAGLGR
jgi:uncharacterized membrane protein